MITIKEINIRNFRSIVRQTIFCKSVNVFVGLNDAGKSNIIKAINLFFNNQTEPNHLFDFATDYSKYAINYRNKAREIEIKIKFEVSGNYTDAGEIIWVKTWRNEGIHKDSFDKEFSPYSKVEALLKRVKFIYVPAVKSEDYFKILLEKLYESISFEENAELKQKTLDYSEALKIYFSRISQIVKKNIGIDSVLEMPQNQKDIFKELIFNTSIDGKSSVALSYRGDGIKSRHIPAILKFIQEQESKMGKNSLPYTVIWGYEEPENGIELLKSYELAKEIYGYSKNIQMFITTHSPAFYSLQSMDGVAVEYVYKSETQNHTELSNRIDMDILNGKIGILPIISPYIQEKEQEIKKLRLFLEKDSLIDCNTIALEGITDKTIIEQAINVLSAKLGEKLSSGELRIITKESGCGTSLLKDWATAWSYSGFGSKLFIVIDSDNAGDELYKSINKYLDENKRKMSSNICVMKLHPSDEILQLKEAIGAKQLTIPFEIEHLLSLNFWEDIIKNNWCKERSSDEMIEILKSKMTMDDTINDTLNNLIIDDKIKNTILRYNPDDDKKTKIAEMVVRLNNDGTNIEMFKGFKRTIEKIERTLKL